MFSPASKAAGLQTASSSAWMPLASCYCCSGSCCCKHSRVLLFTRLHQHLRPKASKQCLVKVCSMMELNLGFLPPSGSQSRGGPNRAEITAHTAFLSSAPPILVGISNLNILTSSSAGSETIQPLSCSLAPGGGKFGDIPKIATFLAPGGGGCCADGQRQDHSPFFNPPTT